MSKTIDQIASDCDLHGADIETLRDILEYRTAVMREQSPTKDGFCDIIEALYRRIEKLEGSLENSITQLRQQTKSWDETLAENRRLEERIEKLEEGRQSSIDCLNHISIDCQMALNETWDTDYDGFRAMLDNVNDTLRKLGAEPPTEDIKK